jgi:very-short-patch-repair endonuclease
MPGVDWDRIRQMMLMNCLRSGNEWQVFETFALKVCGDPAAANILSSIASREPTLFAVHQDKRFKLTLAGIELATSLDRTPSTLHQMAAEAVKFYGEHLPAIGVEIAAADRGQRVLDRFLHALTVGDTDDDLRLTDDTPVQLRARDGHFNPGYVAGLSRDLSTIYVAFEHQVLPTDMPATLVIHRNKTWLDVAEHLEKLKETPARALELRRPVSGTSLERPDSYLMGLDLQYVETPWTKLLWGPPGAGKTYCLASFAAGLMKDPRERILIIAPSNVAVDVLTYQLVQILEERPERAELVKQRKILRYGYPRDERITSRAELLGSAELEKLSDSIDQGYREIRRLTEKHAPEADVAAIRAHVRQLSEERRKRMAVHSAAARIVTTTLAGFAAPKCPLLEAGPWQTVILDEASMMGGAAVMFLASHAVRRFLVVGDPRQLGPVFEWNRGDAPAAIQTWLARDPYEIAGLSTGEALLKEINTNDARVARITNQRRCHPQLWRSVQGLYSGISSDVDANQLTNLTGLSPSPGEALVIMDLSSVKRIPAALDVADAVDLEVGLDYESACRKVGRSWQNPPTAMMAVDMAREIRAQSPDVRIAIISPYRGQVRLIRRLLDDESREDRRLAKIEVGTVHAFQGSESDVVIFDIVDGPPRPGLGVLLRGDSGTRLANVAITRAKGKLLLIAHRAWFLRHTNRAEAGLLWDVLTGADGTAVCKVMSPATSDVSEAKVESPIEQVLLNEFYRRQRELPAFVLQHKIVNESGRIVSRADFAFPSQRIAIFCDGAEHHLKRHQWQRDLRQRRELGRLGWKVLAFTGAEINVGAGAPAVQEIVDFLRNPA